MKTIYENPELLVLEMAVCDVITASGETPKKVINGNAQQEEESGISWGGMW